ncbi:unnamed protein product [Moneuplotes crassus]|uniref:Uncharacterized protein n=1 Tax=Euplotes crassus TaxID=5936 RepID=A0AAD1Y8P8_EUPCR|nr:unnamed protein product [Moneuplotes crassus]
MESCRLRQNHSEHRMQKNQAKNTRMAERRRNKFKQLIVGRIMKSITGVPSLKMLEGILGGEESVKRGKCGKLRKELAQSRKGNKHLLDLVEREVDCFMSKNLILTYKHLKEIQNKVERQQNIKNGADKGYKNVKLKTQRRDLSNQNVYDSEYHNLSEAGKRKNSSVTPQLGSYQDIKKQNSNQDLNILPNSRNSNYSPANHYTNQTFTQLPLVQKNQKNTSRNQKTIQTQIPPLKSPQTPSKSNFGLLPKTTYSSSRNYSKRPTKREHLYRSLDSRKKIQPVPNVLNTSETLQNMEISNTGLIDLSKISCNTQKHLVEPYKNQGPLIRLQNPTKANGWSALQNFSQVLHTLRTKQEKQQKLQRISEIRKNLDSQIKEHRDFQKEQGREKQQVADTLASAHERSKRELSREAHQRIMNMRKEKAFFDRQIDQMKSNRRLFKDQKLKEEKEMLEQVKSKEEKEEKQRKERLIEQRDEFRKIIEENMDMRQKKLDEARREKEEDKKCLEMQEELLIQQELKRKKEREDRLQRVERRMQVLGQNINNIEKQKLEREEGRLNKEIHQKQQIEHQKEQQNKAKIEQNKRERTDVLESQIRMKVNEKRLAQHRKYAEAQQILQNDEIAQAEENLKVMIKTQKEKEVKNSQPIKQKQTEMNDEEFLMNKEILKKISDCREDLENGNSVPARLIFSPY